MTAPITAWHPLSAADACTQAGSDPACGLSHEEAARRLAQHGANVLPEERRKPLWRVFLRQFASPLIYILFAAAVLAFALGKHEDALVILVVVLVNAIIGAFQEGRAERSMASLRKLSSLQVRVLRDGEAELIEAQRSRARRRHAARRRRCRGRGCAPARSGRARSRRGGAHRRVAAGRETYRAAARGHAARGPAEHDLLRHAHHRRARQGASSWPRDSPPRWARSRA